MYKIYDGNSGRVRYVEDAPQSEVRTAKRPPENPMQSIPQFSPLTDKLMSIIPRAVGELETEDIILMLILYLMYKESGDEELLMILGGYLL